MNDADIIDSLRAEITKTQHGSSATTAGAGLVGTYNTSPTGLLGYLTNIEPQYAVMYALVGAAIMAFTLRVAKVTPTVLIAAAVALLVVYLYNEYVKQAAVSYNSLMMFKLTSLDKLTGVKHPYIYTQPKIIDFFAACADMRKFAPASFDTALLRVDMLLKLKYEMKNVTQPNTYTCKSNIEVANDLKTKALTSIWELQFNLPSHTVYATKFEDSFNALQKILSGFIIEMRQDCPGIYDTSAFSTPVSAQQADPLAVF